MGAPVIHNKNNLWPYCHQKKIDSKNYENKNSHPYHMVSP